MLQDVTIDRNISVAFDPRFPIEGRVVGIERGDDDAVAALLVRSPQVEGGTIYLLAEDLGYAQVAFPTPHIQLLN